MYEYEKQNLDKIRNGLSECTVLLKKDGKFPLEAPCKIAAYGSGVRHTLKGGTGSGEVNSRFFVTIEEGLKNAGFTVTTGEWLDGYDKVLVKAHDDFIKEIKRRAKEKHTMAVMEGMGAVMPEPEYELPLSGEGDAAIYVVSRVSGEGNDRNVESGDFKLSETEKRDILALNKKFSKFMLVLNVGGVVDLTPVTEVGNILVLSQLGVETGKALADILLGNAYPSGRLATTWSCAEDYPNVGTFADMNDTRYNEGIYVGYRWFDVNNKKAMFPFGFGLNYTEFVVEDEAVTVDKTEVKVSAKITNVGNYCGKHTLEVYVSCPQGKLDKPCKQLVAFAKTAELKPNESEGVSASFFMEDVASYDTENARYILENGDYAVYVGSSSVDVKAVASLKLGENVTVKQVKNLLGTPDFKDWTPNAINREELNVPVIELDAANFETEAVSYENNDEIDDIIDKLTLDQLCHMNTGRFAEKGGMASVIGSASLSVAGAAGESYAGLKDTGIPNMVMSDGPAGLRITQKYYIDKKGNVKGLGVSIPSTVLEFLPAPLKWLQGREPKAPKGAVIKDQYATAIPIGTALAQSWNLEYAKVCGEVVGDEMERFGVNLWLAPALNIHRTPLCGRNFEYYSEDPFVTGMMAAAVTKGIQSYKGCGVTIKHYAANNQETNRYFSNSVVSERAMREIYLKGFEICIKESNPKAVMSSYNLINGVHANESRELCYDILRKEFGFGGICMTDWLVAGLVGSKNNKYGGPDPALVAAAGGDLYMPGSKGDCERILRGANEGRVSEKILKQNATRVYKMAKELKE